MLNLDEKEPGIPDPCSLIQYKNQKGVETTGGACIKKDASKIHFNFRTNPDESYQKWQLDQAKYIKVSWELFLIFLPARGCLVSVRDSP